MIHHQVKPKAVYIHIPFCQHKCHYCDFNTYVLKGQPVDDYLDALEAEMRQTVEACPPEMIHSFFVGGGTPTVLTPEQMRRFLHAVGTFFPEREDGFEFTMEANPGTVDAEKLAVMREGGVNRISFGAQTFDNRLLRDIGRIHEAEDVHRSLALAREAGFDRLSIDLMFGLPNQTMERLEDSLEEALQLELEHYSLYQLKVEEGTPFHAMHRRNELPLPGEEIETEMYLTIIRRMAEKGYKHYEISNFALGGEATSRHNLTYWRNESYYGIGAGAHGYVRGIRHANVRGVKPYIDAARRGLPRDEVHPVPETEAMEDFMMLGLRVLDGVNQADFQAQFGRSWDEPFGPVLRRLTDQGLIESTGTGYKLTSRGVLLGNEVFAAFLQ